MWRTGLVYDLGGDGRTALKANYSRYALQVGVDRVTAVNPLTVGSRTCPWSDPNGDGVFQASEINVAQCGAFSGGINTVYAADGVEWPYSDEVTFSIERQIMTDMRVGATYYYRTNRDQLGVRNTALPPSAYTGATIIVPNGPGGTVADPKPMTTTVFNPSSTAANNIRDNEPGFDTDYQGIEFTASKRFSRRWQMIAGLTIGKNEGGLGGDLNDPNQTLYPRGIIGNDSKFAFRLSGSYQFPWDIMFAGSLVSNQGYPYVSSYNLTRAAAALQGITLTRASQNITLSQRGDERHPNVTLADIRITRAFRVGTRRVVPTLDIFNIANVATVVSLNNSVGATYLEPREIISPRIIRVGFNVDF